MDARQSDKNFPSGWRTALEHALVGDLPRFRWFSGKARTIRGVEIVDVVAVGQAGWLALAQVSYQQGPRETFVLPVAVAQGAAAERILAEPAGRLAVRLPGSAPPAALYDPLVDEPFARALLQLISGSATAPGEHGQVIGWAGKKFAELRGAPDSPLDTKLVQSEQSNSSIIFGQRLILKLFRRLEDGPNPELEIGAFLTERTNFTQIAPLAGAIEYRRAGAPSGAVAVLQGFVPNQGDAWTHTLQRLDAFFKHRLANQEWRPFTRLSTRHMLEEQRWPDRQAFHIDEAALLGRRTAELHLALASDAQSAELAPEPFDTDSLHADCTSLAQQTLALVSDRTPEVASQSPRLLELPRTLDKLFSALQRSEFSAQRIRCHGDYHLGQVLFTGSDFVILDFEGEPARSLDERRAKHSPLKDVAGMLRSFDYAVRVAEKAFLSEAPETWANVPMSSNLWYCFYCSQFLQAYMNTAGKAPLLPASLDDLAKLLDIYLLEKAIYELKYELNNRPDWVGIPLAAILQIVESTAA